jgi:hypothetical protein
VETFASCSLALTLGFILGLNAAWCFYRRQREELCSIHRQHERERDLLENEIKHHRLERRRVEDQLRTQNRGRHDRNH